MAADRKIGVFLCGAHVALVTQGNELTRGVEVGVAQRAHRAGRGKPWHDFGRVAFEVHRLTAHIESVTIGRLKRRGGQSAGTLHPSVAGAAVVTVGGPIGPAGLAGFAAEVETGRSHLCAVGNVHDACSPLALLRKGVGIRGCPVFELGFCGGGASQRRGEGTEENENEENSTLHTSHPRMCFRAFTSHLNDALTGLRLFLPIATEKASIEVQARDGW